MNVLPAIDLHNGKCVRLLQGNFENCDVYADDPSDIASNYLSMGLESIHVVDLDGARGGGQPHRELIESLVNDFDLSIQVGGGIRSESVAAAWFDAGAQRVVVGSNAVAQPEQVVAWAHKFGSSRLVLALDVRLDANGNPLLATDGWTATAGKRLWDCLEYYLQHDVRNILCTDIARDGALSGPNIALYRTLLSRYPTVRLQASGGVRNIDDLHMLRRIGATTAISGRAILDGRIGSEEIRSFLRAA